jgi:hypothetical protein
MPIVLNSGSLKLLEPSVPVKACNGIALPFTPFFFHSHVATFLRNGAIYVWILKGKEKRVFLSAILGFRVV